MTVKPSTAAALLGIVLLCAAPGTSAQPREAESRPRTTTNDQAVSDLAATLGPHVVKQWRRDNGIVVDAPDADLQTSREVLEKLFADYERLRNAYDTAGSAGQSLAVAAGLGVRFIPNTAGKVASAGLLALVTAGNEEIERVAGHRVRQLLKERKAAILEATGLTYEALRQSGPEAIRAAFTDNVTLLQDVRDGNALDSESWNVAMELLVDAVVNSTERQIDLIETYTDGTERLGAEVAALAVGLHGLETDLDARLQVAEAALPRIGDAVQAFQAAVVNLDDRLATVETNQAVVADFIFDSMPSARKAEALRAGFMARRFECADGSDACEAAGLKAALIGQFEKKAELDALVGDVASVAGAVNDVYAVAANLGIDSPEMNDLVRYGNAAAGAFTQFAAGDYLGALASATSVFGRRTDPDAERFAAMMSYLNREFTRINLKLDRISAKLDLVLENQARLMDAMVALSEQMQSRFRRVDRSLGRLEFEQERLSDGVRSLIWDDWKACHAVYLRAMERNLDGAHAFIDPDTLLLTSERHLQRIVSTAGETLVLPCLETMQGNFASLNALERFGNFIDLDWVVANRLGAAAPEFPVDPEEWRTRLDAFKRNVFAPALAHAVRFVDGRDATSFADAFAALTRPVVSTDDWRATAAAADAVDFTCWNAEQAAHERLFPLLCSAGAGDPNANARRLLESPILADVVNDIADWVLVVAQFADLRDQRRSTWLSYRDLFDAAQRDALDVRNSPGEDLIARSMAVLDVAIASYAMIYGPLAADRIVADVEAGTTEEGSIAALRQNPFLAANTIQLLLEGRYRARFGGDGRHRPTKSAYRAAYEMALSKRSARFVLLEELFGDDLAFEAGEDGSPGVVLQAGDETAVLPVPTPAAFTEGRLLLPPRYYELLATRSRLVDRLYEYRILDDFEGPERAFLGVALTQ